MSNWSSFFKFGGGGTTGVSNQDVGSIFDLEVKKADFVQIDVVNIYSKILTDVVERTDGISDVFLPALWDNCLESENSEGLITMISKAMHQMKELFIVYDRPTKLVRLATEQEKQEIRADYKSQGESTVGTFVSFKNYNRTKMIKIYSELEYCAIASLNKNMNISKALQYKMNDLRGSVALNDKAEIIAQAQVLAKALGEGKDVLTDGKDMIETAKPDLAPTEKAMEFINERRSFYLGMPSSYVTGLAPAGLGDSGEGDTKSIERGLKNYYFSIIKPVLKSVFGIETTFKTEDFRMLSASLQALQSFEVVSEEFISAENKLRIINKLFGFPADTKGGPIDQGVPVESE